jgi:hypothetical protein
MSRNLARQIVITLIMCLAVAIMVVAISFNYGVTSADNVENLHLSQMPAPGYTYPTNEYGQTYGSDSDAPTPNKGPDLVAAYGDCGTLGYVYATDIDDPAPKTPEEALVRQEEIMARLARGEDVSRQVPLYTVDGRTVIGTFTMVSDFSGVIMCQEED